MKNIKVIIMVSSPLTPRWESNFCVDALSRVFDLEYWDCTTITGVPFEANEVLSRDYIQTIDSIETLKKELSKLPQDVVCLSHIHLEDPKNNHIHKIISSFCKNRVFVNFWASEIDEKLDLANPCCEKKDNESECTPEKISLFRKFKAYVYRCYLIQFITKYLVHKSDGLFDLWHMSNIARRNGTLYRNFIISTIPYSEYFINHPDYEKYLSIERKGEKPMVEGKYVVYVDQYILRHPHVLTENQHLSIDIPSLEEPFYASLNRFFAQVERDLNCQVVIAAHPVANYTINPFNGRKIVYFKTAELIKDCIAVCMHCSYSISYVLLYDKPVCLMVDKYTNKIPTMHRAMNLYHKVFRHPLIDITEANYSNPVFSNVSPKIRESFLKKFFDRDNTKTNAELMVQNIIKIHEVIANEMDD